jgi:hypothetical protein
MMPTFPLSSLKFHTAGFPQYGFKAGRSDRAFPFDASSPRTVCHCPSCSPLPSSVPRFVPGGRCALKHLRSSGRCRSTPGALAPDRVVLSRSILTCGPIRPTRRHIPISPLRGLYEMPSLCTLRLGDPPSGSTLSLSFLPNMPPSTTPGRSETGWFQSCGPDIGLRHVMGASVLPTMLLSASRRADFSELPWFAFAAAGQVARPIRSR